MAELIAREGQLNKLSGVLRQAMGGRFQVAFVTGEAGAGKTVLVEAFAERAKREAPGLIVAGSHCRFVAGGAQEPYFPFIQILDTLASTKANDPLWGRLRRGMAELAPDWLQVVPGGGMATAIYRTIQWGRRELGDHNEGPEISRRVIQYVNALTLVAQTAPLLLWIDDLHWSDNATLDLISFLADHASTVRIMLVGTYRPTDVVYDAHGQPHALNRLVSKLNRYQQCIKMEIPVFTQPEMEQLLAVSGHRLSPEFLTRLYRESGGNPLFVREYVNLLHARHLLTRKRGGFELVRADIEIEIPQTVQVVIEQRLTLIERDLLRVLSYASVQGERFASRVLAQLLATPELDVLEKLNLLDRVHRLIHELEKQHLIIKTGAEYQFTHALIQQVIYNDLSQGQRRQLHLAIARLLENLYGEDILPHAADLAVHFEKGDDIASAVRYYLQASSNALAALALDDALDLAMKVRYLAGQLGEDEHSLEWHVQALIRIAEARYLKAEFDDLLAACDDGEALCKLGTFGEYQAHLLYWRSLALGRMGRIGDAVPPARQALHLLGDAPSNRRLQGDLYTRLGSLHNFLPLAEIEQALNTALAIADAYSLHDVKVRTLIQRAWVAMNRLDKPDHARAYGEQALAIAEQYKLLEEQVGAHRVVAYAYRRLGLGSEAFTHNEQAVESARRRGLPRALALALYSLANSLYEVREEWQESLRILRKSAALSEQYRFPVNRDILTRWFDIAFGLGLWREAEHVLGRFHERIEPSYPRSWGSYYRMRGHLAFAFGRFGEAADAYEQAISAFDESSPDERSSRIVQTYLAHALLAAGKVTRAVEHLEEAEQYWQGRFAGRLARSLRGLARADLALGNSDLAVARLREASALVARRYSEAHWPEAPQVSVDLGRVLLLTGEVDEALQQALQGYAQLKKWGHFLLGEASFVVGQILTTQGKRDEALLYLHEARRDWQRLGLTQHLPVWTAFMQEHDYQVQVNIDLYHH